MIGIKLVEFFCRLFFFKSKRVVRVSDVLTKAKGDERLRRAKIAQEADLVCKLRITRLNLEQYLQKHPKATYDFPEAKAVLVAYLDAYRNLLLSKDISPHSEKTYGNAHVLQYRRGCRELPQIRRKFLE